MKKILIFITFVFLQINLVLANLEVKTNLESWIYDFPIEINIIVNQKDAKIFYYTDWEWRMDNIKEFKKPFLIKENTQIDYYATNKSYEDTLIKTSIYTFNYSKNIDINWEKNNIIIKNNSWDIKNIWYWRVEANNLNYEINPNTFLEKNKTFNINYNLSDNEEIKLISPDKKVIKTFVYKIPKEVSENLEEKIEENQKVEEILNSTWVENLPIINEIQIENKELIKNEGEKIIENIENSWFSLNENLKSSTLDTKKTWNKNNIYIIILIFWSLILYNVWLLLTKTETYKKIKNKKK